MILGQFVYESHGAGALVAGELFFAKRKEMFFSKPLPLFGNHHGHDPFPPFFVLDPDYGCILHSGMKKENSLDFRC